MRIAILSPFYPYRGGIAQFSAMLYTSLQREGCEVQAFNFKRLYPDLLFPGKTQYVEEGDDVIRIDGRRILDSIDPLSYFRTVKEIKDWKPDVLVILLDVILCTGICTCGQPYEKALQGNNTCP